MLVPAAARAQQKPTSQTFEYSAYEKETIARALEATQSKLEPAPQGKIIEALDRLRTRFADDSLNTGEMVANIYEQIAYLSTVMTLEPGDVLATGTPSGVGMAMEPPAWLKVGDVMRVEIDGIGSLENPVR